MLPHSCHHCMDELLIWNGLLTKAFVSFKTMTQQTYSMWTVLALFLNRWRECVSVGMYYGSLANRLVFRLTSQQLLLNNSVLAVKQERFIFIKRRVGKKQSGRFKGSKRCAVCTEIHLKDYWEMNGKMWKSFFFLSKKLKRLTKK